MNVRPSRTTVAAWKLAASPPLVVEHVHLVPGAVAPAEQPAAVGNDPLLSDDVSLV